MNYVFDGSFLGLMTVVFNSFLNRKNIVSVEQKDNQASLFVDAIYVDTDREKAERVIRYLKNEISMDFYKAVQQAFLSDRYNKDTVIVKIVGEVSSVGVDYLKEKNKIVDDFNKIVKEVRLDTINTSNSISFKKMKEDIYFSVIKPKSDILSFLMANYKKNLNVQRFAIYDAKRSKVAYFEGGEVKLFDMNIKKMIYPGVKEEFKHLWDCFYEAISEKRSTFGLTEIIDPKTYGDSVVSFSEYVKSSPVREDTLIESYSKIN